MRSTRRPFFIIVVPALIAFFVFHTIPVIIGVFFSFTNFAGFGSWEFVGLRNYINLFGDDRILGAYAFTAGFAVVATLATNIISLAIALALNAKIVGRNLFRGIFFMPYVLTALIVAYVFQFIFATSIPGLLSGEGWLARSGWGWVEVLRVYYAHDGALQQAADALFMHKNTLGGRLDRPQALTGLNPRSRADGMLFQLAVEFLSRP